MKESSADVLPARTEVHIAGEARWLQALLFCPPGVVATGLVLVFLVLSVKSTIEESLVFDEVVDLPSGYLSAAVGDLQMNAEHGIIPRQFAALPLLCQDIEEMPERVRTWEDEWGIGYKFLYGSANRPSLMLVSGRLATLFWGLLLILSVYAVSRDRFGEAGGLLSLVLATFCPTLLAHAHLVTCDVAVTALMFLTMVATERWSERPSVWRAAQVGILLGGGLLSKHSALILVPVIPLVAAMKWIWPKEGEPRCTRWTHHHRSALVCAGAAFLLIWAAYRFRFTSSITGSPLPWDRLTISGTLVGRAVIAARGAHLLPEAYLFGFSVIYEHATKGHEAYALGLYSTGGWWWYYPFVFLVKTPLSSLILFGWGILTSLRKGAESRRELAIWQLAPLSFALPCLLSSIDIGVRQILPIFPFLWVQAGSLMGSPAPPRPGRKQFLVAALAVFGVLDCLACAPHFIPYFNLPARMLWERYELLADSNVDSGQDLIRLKDYLDTRQIPEIKLAYFGTASPGQLGLRHKVLPGRHLYSYFEKWPEAEEIRPGDLVAVSVTNLVGVYLPDKHYYLRKLGHLKPVDRIGHSIYIYKIPEKG